MGVLYCSRPTCPNVMCNRYSWRYGYICNGCFDELVALGPKTDIELFMGVEPKPFSVTDSFEFFNNIFEDGR